MSELGNIFEARARAGAQQQDEFKNSLSNYRDYITKFGTLAPTTRGTNLQQEFSDPDYARRAVQQLSSLGIDTTDPYQALYGSAWNTNPNNFATGNLGTMLNGSRIGVWGGMGLPRGTPVQYAWGNEWNHVSPGQLDNLLATGATIQNGGLKYDPTYGLLYNKNIQVDTGESKNSFEKAFQTAVPIGIAMMAGYGAGMSYFPTAETAAGTASTAGEAGAAGSMGGGTGITAGSGGVGLGTGSGLGGSASAAVMPGVQYVGDAALPEVGAGVGSAGGSGISYGGGYLGLQAPTAVSSTGGLTVSPGAAGGFMSQVPSMVEGASYPGVGSLAANAGTVSNMVGTGTGTTGTLGSLGDLASTAGRGALSGLAQGSKTGGQPNGILGSLIGAGLQYNAGNQLNSLADKMAAIADPFASQRGYYQQQLKNLYENPNSFQFNPAYLSQLKLGQDAVERSAAARGLGLSGNVLTELNKYGQDVANQAWNNEVNRLGTFAGANAGNPAAAAQGLGTLGTLGIANQNASFGNIANNALNSAIGQKVGGAINGAVNGGLDWLGKSTGNWWDNLTKTGGG